MFCRYCGKALPDDSLFCSHCGQRLAEAPAQPPCSTQVFTFPADATYDRVSASVNEWLARGGIRIRDAHYTVDAVMLAGAIVPVIPRLALDWEPEETEKTWQMAVMLDSRSDFGLLRRKTAAGLQRQFDRWQEEHPEFEVAGKQEMQLSLGWTSGWATLFFYR